MTDKRRHRGPHPADPDLFGDTQLPTLQQAVAELSWLLSRGYGDTAALKLVGDRHGLTARQRAAVQRAACADAARRARRASRQPLAAIRGRPLYLDGYNVLTSVEAGLAGGDALSGWMCSRHRVDARLVPQGRRDRARRH
jgi:hypothetical protein